MKSVGRVAALAAMTLLSGCVSNLATISYRQIGACVAYTNNIGDAVSIGPHAAAVIFRIENLDNTKSKIPFDFNPGLLYTNAGSTQVSVDVHGQLNTLLLGNQLTSEPAITIPAGTAKSQWGYLALEAVPTVSADGLTEASNTPYTLYYNTPAKNEPGVVLIKNDLTQTSWPKPAAGDCTALINSQSLPNG